MEKDEIGGVHNMSKISDFEQRIIKQGMTDQDLIEYGKLLKKVRDNFLKRQHCYTTAAKFPSENADQAINLIQFGLENFEDSWFSTYQSYWHIGCIYKKISNYEKAFASYLLAKEALGTDHPDYVKDLSIELLWMKLHIDSFCYSQELENYYSCYITTDDFSKSFINNEFRLAVANLVIALHYGNKVEAKEALDKAREISKPDYLGKLYNILARHHYKESFKTTREAENFIKNIKI